MMEQIVVITFYQFMDFADYKDQQPRLKAFCDERGIKGTILVAPEGINATLAGSRQAVDQLVAHLRSDDRMGDMVVKESHVQFMPFKKMKVRLKQEIVALGVQGVDPNAKVGTYVEPEEWNDLISDPEVLVIDTRNDFEVEIGTFANAVNPKTLAFRDFPDYVRQQLDGAKDKKIAMFCTGGIRCEKATSFMLEEGFEEVYHLHGGILRYLETIPEEQSLWEGECFVFDERIALDHQLRPGETIVCDICKTILPSADAECPNCDENTISRFR